MAWIQTIDYNEANPALKKIYDRVKGPNDNVDNVLTIHSLRPHTLKGHMTLYKAVLHNSNNSLPKWFLEAIGVFVSGLNNCDYCVQHHAAGLRRLLADDDRFDKMVDSLKVGNFDLTFDKRQVEGLNHAKKLTLELNKIEKGDIDNLIAAGFDEGEVLEINQVTSYFNYVNRSVLGLGVNTDGDIIGLSPGNSDNPDDWGHN